jgi:3-hydroxypropanoate dehydrogenase
MPSSAQAVSNDPLLSVKRARAVDEHALRTLFLDAHTANGFLEEPLPRELLDRALELSKWGPTSMNSQPMRLLFVTTPEAKERLRPALAPGNVDKTMAAPATAIVAAHLRFYDELPRMFPQSDGRAYFSAPERASMTERTAFTNATLQGAYFMLALRALGLDVGPMAGFDNAKVDEIFFAGEELKSIWLINIGYADDAKIYPRNPRLALDEMRRYA